MSDYPSAPSENLPMSADQVEMWWSRVRLDRERRDKESRRWSQLFEAYQPAYNENGDYGDLNSNIHFRNAHLKLAEVWAQLPELQLTPLDLLAQGLLDPQTQQPMPADRVMAIKRAVLTKLLGRDYANVDLTIREALFDIFATSGIGATKICYESDVQEIPQEVAGPPTTMPGSILGLQEVPGTPIQKPQPVVVNERVLWYRFSTAKLLIPHGWTSTDYDKAPYLGMEFSEEFTPQVAKKYNLPADFSKTFAKDELLIDKGQKDPGQGSAKLIKGVELWLHAADFDPAVANRDVFYQLVLVEGMKDRPAIYRLSPYQDIGPTEKFPQNPAGKLTPDSMIGNSIHPITLRVASDTAWIQSDACFTDPLVQIENVSMTQDMLLHEANIPRFLHAASITQQIDKLRDAGVGQGVAVGDDILARGASRLLLEIPHLEKAQADQPFREDVRRAIQETLGMGANQAGSQSDTIRSATEVATIQANVSVRMRSEQNTLMSRFLQGIPKFDALIMRYWDAPDFVEIVGQDGARQLAAYQSAHLNIRCSYDARIDTQLTQDQATVIKRATDFVNFMAKSPYMNQGEIARVVTNAFGYDPSRMVKQPDPPPPPPISINLAIGAPGLAANLLLPEVRAILQAHGIQLSPQPSLEAVTLAQLEAAKGQEHGGASDKADLVNKHHSEETGNQPGVQPMVGQAAPQTGGVIQ